jgi:hypothetical protein
MQPNLNSTLLDTCQRPNGQNNKMQLMTRYSLKIPSTGVPFTEMHSNAVTFLTRKLKPYFFEFSNCESHEATPTQLAEAIMHTAERTLTELKEHPSNWFNASEAIVQPLCDADQQAYKHYLADSSDATNANVKHPSANTTTLNAMQN